MQKTSINRITAAITQSESPLLSVFYTAGFPNLSDTVPIAQSLANNGVDMIEIGMPYSDPIADGPVIQASSEQALANGMTIDLLFDQLATLRDHVQIPVLLMGYINPVLQYGLDRFVQRCIAVGIDGVIIPDLPPQIYQRQYQAMFEAAGLVNVLLVSPQTTDERIRLIDDLSTGFIYAVSSASITGGSGPISSSQADYFKRLDELKLKTPHIIGFGISDGPSFRKATEYAAGAIVGTAFVKLLQQYPALYTNHIPQFVLGLKS